jgi:hypothetical protein
VVDPKYQLAFSTYKAIKENDLLTCEVLEFDYDHKSFQLKYLSKVE